MLSKHGRFPETELSTQNAFPSTFMYTLIRTGTFIRRIDFTLKQTPISFRTVSQSSPASVSLLGVSALWRRWLCFKCSVAAEARGHVRDRTRYLMAAL